MATITTVQCPSCNTEFPIDGDKVPVGGVRTQCTVCQSMFRVDPPETESWVSEPVDEVLGFETEEAGDLEVEAEEPGREAVVDEEGPVEHVWEVVEGSTDDADWMTVLDAEPEPAVEADAEIVAEIETEAVAEIETELEVETAAEWSTSLGDDWVLETEDSGPLGGVEVDPLDTVEEEMRSAADEPPEPEDGIEQVVVPGSEEETFPGYVTGDEVMLSVDDLGGAIETGAEESVDLAGEDPFAGATEVEEALTEEETVEEARAESEAVTEPEAPGEFQEPEPAPAPFQFGKRDPHDKARRLARVLVSDMITYNPDRHAKALEARTLKADFDEEIEKSWAEYVEQVGSEIAESTDYWTDALNEILAKGESLF